MATSKLCITTTLLLSLHTVHSYILLTANMEDVHAIVKQIAASPIANQLNQIIHRASNIFNQQINKSGESKIFQRADSKFDEGKDYGAIAARSKPSSNGDVSEFSGEGNDDKDNRVERRNAELVELGKNASFYLKSIKKIFESV